MTSLVFELNMEIYFVNLRIQSEDEWRHFGVFIINFNILHTLLYLPVYPFRTHILIFVNTLQYSTEFAPEYL